MNILDSPLSLPPLHTPPPSAPQAPIYQSELPFILKLRMYFVSKCLTPLPLSLPPPPPSLSLSSSLSLSLLPCLSSSSPYSLSSDTSSHLLLLHLPMLSIALPAYHYVTIQHYGTVTVNMCAASLHTHTYAPYTQTHYLTLLHTF